MIGKYLSYLKLDKDSLSLENIALYISAMAIFIILFQVFYYAYHFMNALASNSMLFMSPPPEDPFTLNEAIRPIIPGVIFTILAITVGIKAIIRRRSKRTMAALAVSLIAIVGQLYIVLYITNSIDLG